MNHYKTISEYCKAINIPPPKHPHFDIRSFQDNMAIVVNTMPPFRHEFYAIAIKSSGSGKAVSGHHINFPQGATIFFNSPFQILSWAIKPNWEGYYIIFSQDFIAKSHFLQNILEHFSFLKIEKDMPFEIAEDDVKTISEIYQSIQVEYINNKPDKFQLIESYVLLLLNFVKRYFKKNISQKDAWEAIRKTDLKLLSQFQTLIETSFQNKTIETFANLHSTSYYAQKLSIHPNHLNAVVKDITGLTAKQHIQKYLLNLAKSQLIHTEKSVKEIAYSLYFDTPNNFSSFFKKMTSKTPNSYRKEKNL